MDLTIEPLSTNKFLDGSRNSFFFLPLLNNIIYQTKNLMCNFRKTPLTSSLVEQFITSANVGAVVRN